MSDDIIQYARELISEDNIEFENVLKSIEEDRTRIEANKDETEKYKRDLETKNRELEKEIEKVKSQKDKVIRDAKNEAKRILNLAKDDVSLVLDEIHQLKDELSTEQARRLQQAQDVLRENLDDVTFSNDQIRIEKAKNPVKKLKVGDSVRVSSLNAEGTVIELEDSSNNVLVQVGMMKMKLPKESLVKSTASEEKIKRKTKTIIERKAKSITSEIDVRGMVFDDAKIEVDKYIDDAYLSGLKSVRIIHGKGSGVLRIKLKEDLRYNPHVKSTKDAAYNEGGSGVSIVELK